MNDAQLAQAVTARCMDKNAGAMTKDVPLSARFVTEQVSRYQGPLWRPVRKHVEDGSVPITAVVSALATCVLQRLANHELHQKS